MIDQDELDMFYEEGDKLLESYEKYVDGIKDMVINNEEIQQVINNLIEILGNNMVMLSKIMDEIADLETEIMADINHPYLQSIEAVRKIKEYIKMKQKEYLLRIQNDAKIKATLYFVLDKYEDYEIAIEEANIKVKEIGPKERKEIKKESETEDEDETPEKKIDLFAELVDEYTQIKEDQNVEKKRLRLNVIKNKIKNSMGNEKWINAEFEKHTGDRL